MTTLETNNGQARQRRRLDDSIARMDQLIEGLADAIPGTIKDVLEESVSSAISAGIKAAVLEGMSNPELFSALRGALPPTTPLAAAAEAPMAVPCPQPSRLGALLAFARSKVAGAYRWGRNKIVAAAKGVAGAACGVVSRVRRLHHRLRITLEVFKSLLLPFAVGGLAVAIALIAPNWAVIALSGLGGTCLTFVVQVGWWVRRKFGSMALTNN